MISATGARRSMASSRLVTATPKTLSTRRVSSLGMYASRPSLGQVQRRHVDPARVARGLEVLRVHEMHPVMQVQLELATAVARPDPPLGIVEERLRLGRRQADEPLEANGAGVRLLDTE